MQVITDGITPVPRFVMVDDLGPDFGYFCELTEPLFLAPGDRILFDGMRTVLTVTRTDGTAFSPTGRWGVRCGDGPRI
ncbi:hypothetical protein ACFV1W_19740 [Kitasatospora sp. NPDC059648]|uniref:hypothetical protein n=1 Tax=Kitasatospora sp. NPDC059648 TaxID=3346894 RepID=UPI00367DC68A